MECRESLLQFTELTKPEYAASSHHSHICDALEAVERGDIDRLMIFMPPRHGKSELTTRRFPAWAVGRKPTRQIITGTYAQDLATDFGRDVRNIIATEEFQAVFPGVRLRQDSKSANRWHTNHSGSYAAVGRGGPATGRGAHLLILDDLFKDRMEAYSSAIRDQAWGWYTTVARTRLMPKGSIVYTTTRWHEDDPAGRILNGARASDWEIIEFPAIDDSGQALWPEWYPLDVLERIRDDLPAQDWQSLYQQQPQPEQGTFFKRDWFWRYDPDDIPTVRKYLTSDFAVTDEADANDPDYTEIGIHGVQFDGESLKLYLLIDSWNGRTEPDSWIDEYLNLVGRHKPFAEFNEAGVIRRSIEGFLKRRRSTRRIFGRCEWVASIRDKSARARALQGMASMGQVGLPNNQAGDRALDQLLSFPTGTHDDCVDMLTLFARVIDEAHPAVQAAAQPKIIQSRYDRAFERQEHEADSWRM